jgi:1,4-alpha-glucan branching enzyme
MVKRRRAAVPTSTPKARSVGRGKKATRPRPAVKRQKPKKRVVSHTRARAQEAARTTRLRPRVISTRHKSVTFTLDAPSAWTVSIAGTFNNWEPQALAKGSDGVWRIPLQLAPGTYEYRFLVDAEWRDDPNNPRKRPNEYGGNNSVCEVM